MNSVKSKLWIYLTDKVRNNETIPSLREVAKDIDVNYSTMCGVLQQLNKQGKIVYKCGKIKRVLTENIKGENIQKAVEQHKNKYTISELEEKYNKIVKDIICECINNIDASSFTNDNINNVLTNITLITNKVKDRLFK